MKTSTKTILLSALMLAAITQPAHAMFEKYTTMLPEKYKMAVAFVGGLTLGAGLIYYLSSNKSTESKPENQKLTLCDQATQTTIVEISHPKKSIGKKIETDISSVTVTLSNFPLKSLDLGTIYCSLEDFNTLKKTTDCFFINVGSRELKLYSINQKKEITLLKNKHPFTISEKGSYTLQAKNFYNIKDIPENIKALVSRKKIEIVHDKDQKNKIEFKI